ncbi:hypothetical protein PPBDW_II1068 [Photobacterium kishitanii]|nr:hypothetical protein PPBDW_II1068 [Photobacterium kishitanii]
MVIKNTQNVLIMQIKDLLVLSGSRFLLLFFYFVLKFFCLFIYLRS